MSAMLETYDMQMVDYSGDLDIQMQPSSSDQWFQDSESKMEEDGPSLLKLGDDSHSKSNVYAQEKPNTTIEVDMEPFVDEYDMVDDEQIHESATEILDVELYDASYAHSPAMLAVESTQEDHPGFLSSFPLPNSDSTLNKEFVPEPLNLVSTSTQNLHVSHEEEPAVHYDINETASHHGNSVAADMTHCQSHKETKTEVDFPEASIYAELAVSDEPLVDHEPQYHPIGDDEVAIREEATSGFQEQPNPTSVEGPHQHSELEYVQKSGADATDMYAHLGVANIDTGTVDIHAVEEEELHPQVQSVDDNVPHVRDQTESYDAKEENAMPTGSGASAGDPHEISEGVYIDPPPPVLLSMSSDDRFDFSFFNEAEDVPSSRTGGKDEANDRVLLANFPTLYYEPLSTVFDALRQEQIIQNTFNLPESELVLEAFDLQLPITEDNIYAREVTLHDLNVLHDVSGIEGSLRIRIYVSAPRFISRYQHLQEEVSRLHLEPALEEHPIEGAVGDEASHTEYIPGQTENETAQEEETQPAGSEPTKQGIQDDKSEQLPSQGSDVVLGGDNVTLSDQRLQESNEIGDVNAGQLNEQTNIVAHQGDLSGTPSHHSTPTHYSSEIGESVDHGAEGDDIALATVEAGSDVDTQHADGEYSQHQGEDESQNEQEEYGDFEAEADHIGFEEVASEQQYEPEQPEESDEIFAMPKTTTDELETADHDVIPEPTEEGAYDEADNTVDRDATSEAQVDTKAHIQSSLEQTIDSGGYIQSVYWANLKKPFIDPAQCPTSVDDSEKKFDLPILSTSEPQTTTLEFGEETWEDDLDGEGDPDTTWDDDDNENEQTHSNSNDSSVTLSSKASKRSFDELDSGGEGYEDGDGLYGTPPSSPGAKRTRTH